MYIPRLKKINDILPEMKKRDPKTALKWRTVQYMIKQGAITSIKFGDAWLINIDELYNYFTKAGKNE